VAHACPTCLVTTVRYASQVCAQCRNKGSTDLNKVPIQVYAPGQVIDPRLLMDQQFGILNEQQVAIRALMAEEKGYRIDLSKEARELTGSVKGLLQEWRMLERDAIKKTDQLSKEQKREIFVAWLRQQDMDYIRDVVSEVTFGLDMGAL
jgi:hypothetical protein